MTCFCFNTALSSDPSLITCNKSIAVKPYVDVLAKKEAELSRLGKEMEANKLDANQRLQIANDRKPPYRRKYSQQVALAAEEARVADNRAAAAATDLREFRETKEKLMAALNQAPYDQLGSVKTQFELAGLGSPSLTIEPGGLAEASYVGYLRRLTSNPSSRDLAGVYCAIILELVGFTAWILLLKRQFAGKPGENLLYNVIAYLGEWRAGFCLAFAESNRQVQDARDQAFRLGSRDKCTPNSPKRQIRYSRLLARLKADLESMAWTAEEIEEVGEIQISAMHQLNSLMVAHDLRMADRLKHCLEIRDDLVTSVRNRRLRKIVEQHANSWVRDMGGIVISKTATPKPENKVEAHAK